MRSRLVLAALLSLPLSGCGDPYSHYGTWHAAGVNQANLSTEAVRKSDLVLGHEDPGSDAVLDAAATARLHADHAKPLPQVSTSSVGGGS